MDAKNKRQQTTKGVWIAQSPHITSNNNTGEDQNEDQNEDKLFILDVEGSDGVERGEDQDFERKAALFALAVSEVLMINLWEQQIGLYQGNNLGLLKTVFEVNLSLFGVSHEKRKTLLLFVIRDHIGVTPIESLAESLTNELNKIWDQLNKPKDLAHSTLNEFFDLEFVGLGHKFLQEEKFNQDVKNLGDSFQQDNRFFKPIYHNNNLPLDAWNLYANNCWDQIENNKDLDLPTQQILVARFKTNEILEDAIRDNLSDFNQLMQEFHQDINDLLPLLIKLKSKTLQQYDKEASHYIESIYSENKLVLSTKINNIFLPIIKLHISNFIEALFVDLKAMINNISLQKNNSNNKKPFIELITDLKLKIGEKFIEILHKFQSNELLNKQDDIFQDDFDAKLNLFTQDLINKQLSLTINNINKKINYQIKNDIAPLFINPKPDLWDNIINKFNSIIDENLNKYKTDNESVYDFQMGLTESQNNYLTKKIRIKSWINLNNTIHDTLKMDTIINILRECFENSFRYDENDMPILWKDDFEIDKLFKIAKEKSLNCLDILTKMQLENGEPVHIDYTPEEEEQEEQDPSEEEIDKIFNIDQDELDSLLNFHKIVNDTELESILRQFKRQINVTVIDAKRSILRSNTHIPIWIYFLIVVLGWNEFMIILKNPMYVTLSIIALVTFYFIHKFDLWDPVLRVTYTAIGETRSTVKNKLRDYVLDDNEKNPNVKDTN